MAISFTEAVATTGTGQGPTSVTYADLTPPTDARALLVALGATANDSLTATYGGVAMTLVDGGAGGLCKIYELLDLSGVSGDDLVIGKAWYVEIGVEAVWLVDSVAPALRIDENNGGGSINGPGTLTVALDPGANTGVAAYVVGTSAKSGGVSLSDIAPASGQGQTQLSEAQIPVTFHPPAMNVSYKTGISTSQTLGITTGGALQTMRVTGALYVPDVSDVVIAPDRWGEETAFRAGMAVEPSSDTIAYPTRITSEETAFRAGVVVRPYGPRQVALVGQMLETSEMTEGGTEGQVLTYHGSTKPTWEDPGGGAEFLDDLLDVNAPSPGDGEVLTWDDYAGEWISAPGATGSGNVVGVWDDADPGTPAQDESLWYDTDEDAPDAPAESSGTSFPVSPTNQQRFYRTDVRGGMWFRWNSSISRWLSEQIFTIQMEKFSAASVDTSRAYHALPTDYPVYLTSALVAPYVSGAATWVVNIETVDFDGDIITTLVAKSTAAQTAGKFYRYYEAINAYVACTTGVNATDGLSMLSAWVDEQTGTATFYGSIAVDYRLVAT
jgi:hypothetical protein